MINLDQLRTLQGTWKCNTYDILLLDEVFTMSKDLISLSILTDERLAKKIEFRNDLPHMTIGPKPTCPILR